MNGAAKLVPVIGVVTGIVITNGATVIDDPVRVGVHHADRDDGTGDGRIDVAIRDGAQHRASRHRRDAQRRPRGVKLRLEERRAAPR